MVDEWGIWWDEELGIVCGYLYQQNMLCDVFVVFLILDVFYKYMDCIKMINIVQIVNVFQFMILIKDDKMVLILIYYVFEMYKVYQDVIYFFLELNCECKIVCDDCIVLMVSVIVLWDVNGLIYIFLFNVDLQELQEIELNLGEVKVKSVIGCILIVNNIGDYNSFEKLNVVVLKEFIGVKVNKGSLKVIFFVKFIVVLEVK